MSFVGGVLSTHWNCGKTPERVDELRASIGHITRPVWCIYECHDTSLVVCGTKNCSLPRQYTMVVRCRSLLACIGMIAKVEVVEVVGALIYVISCMGDERLCAYLGEQPLRQN